MEQSTNEDDGQDAHGDKEERNDEATTSKAVFNDPTQSAYNVNDLKALEFNSADEVRQAMKALLQDKKSQDGQDGDSCSLIQHVVSETDLKKDCHHEKIDHENVIVNVDKVNTNQQASGKKQLRLRKRPGRPPKPGPSKRYKKTTTDVFYYGKLPSMVFVKRKYVSHHSSDDDTILFFD